LAAHDVLGLGQVTEDEQLLEAFELPEQRSAPSPSRESSALSIASRAAMRTPASGWKSRSQATICRSSGSAFVICCVQSPPLRRVEH
jgi:hypothetical protein